mmetsp:Transcript_65244/g.179032  ORF Transcript_65244/g.179032 Transcript_65244/m.179032 type:complete len:133 (+) Transcript_65244:68-466(+)
MGQAQTKPGCVTSVTALHIKGKKFAEAELLLSPMLKEMASWAGMMSATVSMVSDTELTLIMMYEDMTSLEANKVNLAKAMEPLLPLLSKSLNPTIGTISHCVGLGVGLAAKESMPASVMTPASQEAAAGSGH